MIKACDIQAIRLVLHYCPNTGIFFRRDAKGEVTENIVGCKHSMGYVFINILGTKILAHRLAWIFIYGANPKGQLDHINGNRKDNRIENLRIATQSENNQNQRAPRGKNQLMGAYAKGSRWESKIKINGESIHLGAFATEQEAHLAYISAKKKYHPFFNGNDFPSSKPRNR